MMSSNCWYRRLLLYTHLTKPKPSIVTSTAAKPSYQLNTNPFKKRQYSQRIEDDKTGNKHDNDDDPYIDQERAPSTADMFKKVEKEMTHQAQVAEEKANVGFASQTVDKAYDATSTAMGVGPDDSPDPEHVKQRYKETGPGEDYRRKG